MTSLVGRSEERTGVGKGLGLVYGRKHVLGSKYFVGGHMS